MRKRVERDVLFHFFVDRALDVVNVDVLTIHSATEQCEALVVSVIALARGAQTSDLATADALRALAHTLSAIAVFPECAWLQTSGL